jgi:hypothetical protein
MFLDEEIKMKIEIKFIYEIIFGVNFVFSKRNVFYPYCFRQQ